MLIERKYSLTMALINTYAAERRIHNHGRVGVHQGAEAEGGEAEPGDRLRAAGRAETRLLLPDGTYLSCSHTLDPCHVIM